MKDAKTFWRAKGNFRGTCNFVQELQATPLTLYIIIGSIVNTITFVDAALKITML